MNEYIFLAIVIDVVVGAAVISCACIGGKSDYWMKKIIDEDQAEKNQRFSERIVGDEEK